MPWQTTTSSAEIREAWVKYQVVFFRDQALTPAQQLALGQRFGKIQEQGYAPGLKEHPGVWVQEYPEMYKMPVTDINWHVDGSFLPEPTRGSLLYAVDVPGGAGDTVWSDMTAAFEDLSPAWQQFLDGAHRDPRQRRQEFPAHLRADGRRRRLRRCANS